MADETRGAVGDEYVVPVDPLRITTNEPQHLGSGEQVPGLYLPGERIRLSVLAARMGVEPEEARRRLVALGGIIDPPLGEPAVFSEIESAPALSPATLPEGASDPRAPGEALSAEMLDDNITLARGGTTELLPAGWAVDEPMPVASTGEGAAEAPPEASPGTGPPDRPSVPPDLLAAAEDAGTPDEEDR